jgi:hypothetical protein
MRRILIASAAVLLVAACESATAPTPARSPSATTPRFSGDSVRNDRCDSGWSVPDGRCL